MNPFIEELKKKYPCCPRCGEYTDYNKWTFTVFCRCGWSVDIYGNEEFDPDELDTPEEKI